MKTETDNFILHYYDENTKEKDKIIKILEDNYHRIINFLGIKLTEKTIIHVYKTLKDFHRAIGRPNAEDWVVGNATGGVIRMVSPCNPGPAHDYDSIMAVAIHEFVHIVAEKLNLHTSHNYPYLSEGIATYLAGQKVTLDKSIQIPSAQTIALSQDDDDYGLVYDISYVFMQFIAANFGNDGIIALYKNPEEFVKTHPQLNDMWAAYTKLQ
ncbi:MAG: hypothetical protein FWC71_11070 [Defluviitaleaceae bacterium]|nr:hypothetical protein [Defluviitaleaceae bacterium]